MKGSQDINPNTQATLKKKKKIQVINCAMLTMKILSGIILLYLQARSTSLTLLAP